MRLSLATVGDVTPYASALPLSLLEGAALTRPRSAQVGAASSLAPPAGSRENATGVLGAAELLAPVSRAAAPLVAGAFSSQGPHAFPHSCLARLPEHRGDSLERRGIWGFQKNAAPFSLPTLQGP